MKGKQISGDSKKANKKTRKSWKNCKRKKRGFFFATTQITIAETLKQNHTITKNQRRKGKNKIIFK